MKMVHISCICIAHSLNVHAQLVSEIKCLAVTALMRLREYALARLSPRRLHT